MKLAYVDSSVWISRMEGIPEYRQAIQQTFSRLQQDNWQVCLSGAVRLETLLKPYRENRRDLIAMYQKYFDLAKQLNIYLDLFEESLIVASKEKLKSMDAIHVAIALRYGCNRFVTADSHFKYLKLIEPHYIDLSSYTPR